jgi:hypothetical protein
MESLRHSKLGKFGEPAKLAYPARSHPVTAIYVKNRDGYCANFIWTGDESGRVFDKKTMLQWQVGRITLWL